MSTLVRFTAIRANAKVIPSPEIYAALHEYTQVYCAELVTEVSQYPPPPAVRVGRKEGYVRTFKLLRSWTVKDTSGGVGISYTIRNPAQDLWGRYYSGYVHGPGDAQASFHGEHGWKNIKDFQDRDTFRAGAQAIIQKGALL